MKRSAAVILWLSACSAAEQGTQSTAEQPPHAHCVAIVDATIIPMDTERELAHSTIVACDGAITAMGATNETPIPADAQRIDGAGKFVLPALADMHTHLVREADLALYVANGITTVRNMWGSPIVLDWRRRIEAGELLGPAIVTAGPILDGENPAHDGSLIVRHPQDVDAIIALHKTEGYDFIKVYGGVPADAYTTLLERAGREHIPVAGHVPRAVGLERAIALGQISVEHNDGFLDALQADDSPVRGKWDRASRRAKIDHLDENRLENLVALVHDSGTAICPTRVVKDSFGSMSVARERLTQPAARYVPASERAIWASGDEPSPADLERTNRVLALDDRIIASLAKKDARLLVGTDPGNPLVVAGFSVHDELQHFVRIGLSPYRALRAATVDPMSFLGRADHAGALAVGHRADLLVLSADPLLAIENTRQISGVMLGGRWLDRARLDSILRAAESSVTAESDQIPGERPLGPGEFTGRFAIRWRGAPFGVERIWVGGTGSSRRLQAELYDPHMGQTTRFQISLKGPFALDLSSDGSSGRGTLAVAPDTVDRNRLFARGTSLPGLPFEVELPQTQAQIVVAQSLGGVLGALLTLPAMSPDTTVELPVIELALGSELEARDTEWVVKRLSDTATTPVRRRYAIVARDGLTSMVELDEAGWPMKWTLEAFGSTLEYERIAL
ncbi:MAG: amidohydrolase family protein [Polyangiaceae bacterium]